ncbi:hypothetical protein AM593_09487, partial [Mytilus galloprovincialis]
LPFGLVAIVAANKKESSQRFPQGYFGIIFYACLVCCLPFGLVAMLAAKKGLKATARASALLTVRLIDYIFKIIG